MSKQNDKFSTLQSIYENPLNVGSFSSVYKLYKSGKAINANITLQDTRKFLSTQDSYTLHKPTKKTFLTQQILAPKPKVIISMDLIDIKNISEFNDGFKYLILYVDVFSKYLSTIPILDKTKESILMGLKAFFNKNDNYKYSRIYSDMESGLYSNLIRNLKKKKKNCVF